MEEKAAWYASPTTAARFPFFRTGEAMSSKHLARHVRRRLAGKAVLGPQTAERFPLRTRPATTLPDMTAMATRSREPNRDSRAADGAHDAQDQEAKVSRYRLKNVVSGRVARRLRSLAEVDLDVARPAAISATRWPSTRSVAATAAVAFRTVTSAPRGTTNGRACERVRRDEGHRHRVEAADEHRAAVREVVRGRARRSRADHPVARHHAEILAADRPGELDHPPSVELVTTTSLTATWRSPSRRTSSVGSSTVTYSRRTRARGRARDRPARSTRESRPGRS